MQEYRKPSELETFIHDISTPLTNLSLSLEYIYNQMNSNPREVEKTILSTMNIIEYMISITSPQHSSYYKELPEASTFIKNIIEKKFKYIIKRNRIKIIFNIDKKIQFKFNTILLERVLTNLISNAIDAFNEETIEKKKCLQITVNQIPNNTIIKITDNGVGMDNFTLKHVFDLNFTNKTGHFGIGLTSCKDIIERHLQGKITIESLLGFGTTVTLELPD